LPLKLGSPTGRRSHKRGPVILLDGAGVRLGGREFRFRASARGRPDGFAGNVKTRFAARQLLAAVRSNDSLVAIHDKVFSFSSFSVFSEPREMLLKEGGPVALRLVAVRKHLPTPAFTWIRFLGRRRSASPSQLCCHRRSPDARSRTGGSPNEWKARLVPHSVKPAKIRSMLYLL